VWAGGGVSGGGTERVEIAGVVDGGGEGGYMGDTTVSPGLYGIPVCTSCLTRCILPVWGVFVLEIVQKLILEVNLKGVTSSMHFIFHVIFFAFIRGNTPIECHFSNIYMEKARM